MAHYGHGGQNNVGQLGNNSTFDQSSPVQIGALTTWTRVACGYGSSLALQTGGSLWGWGNEPYGSLGLNTVTAFSSPVQVLP